MSERTSVFGPKSEFKYPLPYSVAKDEGLFPLDNMPLGSDIPFSLSFSPRRALMEWERSSPGQWQAGQTARYGLFHKDLPDKLIPDEHRAQEKEFRLNLLRIMSFGAGELVDDPARTDFHPIGHMARVGSAVDKVLWLTMIPPSGMRHDVMMIDATRHAAVLHDAGETEHIGVVINHGKALGDISSSEGKTNEEKAKERAISSDVLPDVFLNRDDPKYTSKFLGIALRLMNHDIEGADADFLKHHGILEIAHSLNSAYTGIYLGHLACKVAEPYGNILSLLSEQTIKIIKPKFEEAFEHSPELIAPLGDQVARTLEELEINAHSRDENEDWLRWRMSDIVSSDPKFGEYKPWTF